MRSFLRDFFFPPAGSSMRRHMLPFVVMGIITIALLLTIPPVWEFTNSSGFCGTSCHTMPPEYSAYLISPHARVPCVDCHIGRDLLIVQAFRKAGHARLIVDTLLDNYEYPIKTHEMRPARDTCERCHLPEKFSDDSLRTINTFENNRENTPYSVYLLMHTGGGSKRGGLAQGIHWHIENQVSYIPLDENEQIIPWVRVEKENGTSVDYNAIDSPIDTENLDQYDIRQMDCITCHNRISHLLENPSNTVDSALARGDLSRDIPFIRQRAVELLSGRYASFESASQSFATLDEYYRSNYPEFYAEGAELVQDATKLLGELYTQSNYPEQLLTWETHPNNIGHRDTPGCFRCHDGQHFSPEGEVVRLECNVCHSIPQVVRPGEIEPMLPLTTGLEPASHLDSSWISRHRDAFDVTCANCHTTGNPGGTDNSSFCSNSACHGVEWRYAGFDAPGLATMLGIYQFEIEPLLEDFEGDPSYEILQPLFLQQCAGCHGPVPSKGLRVTDYTSLVDFGGESGLAVIPGNPDESLLLKVLTDGHFARLTSHQIDLLTTWITNGAPEQ